MKICIVSAQYLPTKGGVERYTHSLAAELAARGHTVCIVTSRLPNALSAEQEQNGVKIVRLSGLLPLEGRLPVPYFTAGNRRQLNACICEADFTMIQTRFYPLALWAVALCAKQNRPAVIVEHGAGHLKLGGALVTKAVELYEHFFAHFAARRNDAFYAVSHAGLEWLRHFHIKGKGVLYNAVDDAVFDVKEKVDAAEIYQRYGLCAKLPIVFFAGRLIPEKGILQLVQAVAQVAKSHPLQLVVAGDGALLPVLRRKQLPFVKLLGALPRSELLQLLSVGGVFCLPSDSEGMPTALLEAAACGCFPMATAHGGSQELILSAEYGMLLKSNDEAVIAAALRWALTHREECTKAALRAQERVRECFCFSKTADALEEIMRSECGQPHSKGDIQ